ncbi:hypothetical protein EMIHUDRAFT_235029 [Emiliania huxleyi CCMP1516]|uniref:Anaphase-promoting complex subunit 4 WD40 domain-containing protein n=2 Tax=Emiliania huxleyi TaxID=2903 RepID=A0A0D3JXK9_EMIH1|nr:hypothetical protein EMIHUDRAFT_235029 [Emiliania huxleyi CCMP1516]EOD28244.1 hypothetical protein EMIHUDRAFT_235029 [Emiliania huxleyi CCMP1516]|eukprot:XP_005780673.1 hypothetical protein EMIHUDRAFT_235029 [Emiliania huxleyi CCMP1516]
MPPSWLAWAAEVTDVPIVRLLPWRHTEVSTPSCVGLRHDLVLLGQPSGAVLVFERASGSLHRAFRLDDSGDAVTALTASSDLLLVGHSSGAVRLWSLSSENVGATAALHAVADLHSSLHRAAVRHVRFLPSSSSTLAVSCDEAGVAQLLEYEGLTAYDEWSLRRRRLLDGSSGPITAAEAATPPAFRTAAAGAGVRAAASGSRVDANATLLLVCTHRLCMVIQITPIVRLLHRSADDGRAGEGPAFRLAASVPLSSPARALSWLCCGALLLLHRDGSLRVYEEEPGEDGGKAAIRLLEEVPRVRVRAHVELSHGAVAFAADEESLVLLNVPAAGVRASGAAESDSDGPSLLPNTAPLPLRPPLHPWHAPLVVRLQAWREQVSGLLRRGKGRAALASLLRMLAHHRSRGLLELAEEAGSLCDVVSSTGVSFLRAEAAAVDPAAGEPTPPHLAEACAVAIEAALCAGTGPLHDLFRGVAAEPSPPGLPLALIDAAVPYALSGALPVSAIDAAARQRESAAALDLLLRALRLGLASLHGASSSESAEAAVQAFVASAADVCQRGSDGSLDAIARTASVAGASLDDFRSALLEALTILRDQQGVLLAATELQQHSLLASMESHRQQVVRGASGWCCPSGALDSEVTPSAIVSNGSSRPIPRKTKTVPSNEAVLPASPEVAKPLNLRWS